MDVTTPIGAGLAAGTGGTAGHRLHLCAGNTKPCVVASVPCALAVVDAEQADPSKAAEHALDALSTDFVEIRKKALLSEPAPRLGRTIARSKRTGKRPYRNRSTDALEMSVYTLSERTLPVR